MVEVFELIFSIFDNVLLWLDSIPVWEGVSLKDFSYAIFLFGAISSSLLLFVRSPIARVDNARRQRNREEQNNND